MSLQANELIPGDLFIESSDTSVIWQFEDYEDDGNNVVARRAMYKAGDDWLLFAAAQVNEHMNAYADVSKIRIDPK